MEFYRWHLSLSWVLFLCPNLGGIVGILITTEMQTEWTPSNRSWYENNGYVFTKYTSKFTVAIDHLAKSSPKKVEVKCDYCGAVVLKEFNDYNRGRKTGNGKDCCSKCTWIKHRETCQAKYGTNTTFEAFNTSKELGDKLRTDDSLVLAEFTRRNLEVVDFKYINCNTSIEFICPKHREYGVQTTNYRSMKKHSISCRMCLGESMSLDNHPGWKGGISPLETFFKRKISQWKRDSIKECNGNCVITGEPSNIVHHLYGFSNILKETIDELGITLKFSVSNYKANELQLIQDKLLENHYKYPLGVCLTKPAHLLFHHHYGYGNNIPEQFYEFKQRYSNGEFEEVA